MEIDTINAHHDGQAFFELLIYLHSVKFEFEADGIPDVGGATLADYLLHVFGNYPCVTCAGGLGATGSLSEAAACWFSVSLHLRLLLLYLLR